MTRTLLTGATGTLGTPLRSRLLERDHELVAGSRSPPEDAEGEWVELDLASGAGIRRALDGVDVVVHAATAPQGDSQAVDLEGTKRLLSAASEAGVSNFLYVSIVGVDRIPYSYYEHKRAAERAVEEADVPSTIVRATQFHEFVAELLGSVAKLPVWPLPTNWTLQPIAVADAADAVARHATPEASGRVPAVGGPTVHSVRELATAYREFQGLRRPILRLPVPGNVASAFRDGEATRPDRTVGSVTWSEFLGRQYGNSGTAGRPSGSPS
jgi:uncharacterized protein YbjT (DUF2867 family)